MTAEACSFCHTVFSEDDVVMQCVDCRGDFHVGKCSGITARSFKMMKDATKKSLRCPTCKLSVGNSNTAGQSVNLQSELPQINKKLSQMQTLKSNLDKLMGLKETVQNIERSVQHLSDTYDNLKDAVNRQEQGIGELRRRMEAVEQSQDVTMLSKLKQEVNALEQYNRRQNMEIHGLAQRDGENLITEINKIATQLDLPPLSEKDIDGIHRLRSKEGRDPVVLVRFSTRTLKTAWFEKKKNLRSKTQGIKFFDNLTAANKRLLWLAKNKARELNYQFVWSSQGTIFVRKQPNARAIRLATESDLDKIV